MLLHLQKFDFDIVFKPGVEMYMADTLSRAYLKADTRSETEKKIESVNLIQHLPITTERCKSLQLGTQADAELQMLSKVIRNGWPNEKTSVHVDIQKYFPFREELTIQNGLIFKSDKVVVPENARADLMARAHSSHIGIQGCLRRARECLYWPNMNADIEKYIKTCDTCNTYNAEQQKESLHSHETVHRPWEKIGIDLFEFNQKDYLMTVDYYSDYFEIDRLNNKKGKEVIAILKKHFARYGLPDEVFSDNGPLFNGHEFRHFANQYEFAHSTSSPGFPQSNGKVENAIKTAKRLMIKSHKDESDPYLSLLDWRNTPSEGLDSSPSQRMFGRRGKTLLPSSSRLLKPDNQSEVLANKKVRKEKQQYYYNRNAKDKPELMKGDVVRIKPFRNGKEWTKARVDDKCNIRSYKVTTEDGRTYRRNRRHLVSTKEPMIEDETETHIPNDNDEQTVLENDTDNVVTQHDVALPIRRSNRIRQRPNYLQDYVCSAHYK